MKESKANNKAINIIKKGSKNVIKVQKYYIIWIWDVIFILHATETNIYEFVIHTLYFFYMRSPPESLQRDSCL
jgi:hypothetical protein